MLCSQCEARDYRPSAWLEHIWFLYRLRQGGYPFKANDLSIEEWIDLGVLKESLKSRER